MIDVCESPVYTPVYMQILGKCEKIPKFKINSNIYLKELLSYEELLIFLNIVLYLFFNAEVFCIFSCL